MRTGWAIWRVAVLALAVSRVALAGSFPLHVLRKITLPDTAPVRALAFGPAAKRIYAAAGSHVYAYELSGHTAGSVSLPGTVTGLAVIPGSVLYATVGSPARLVMLGVRPLHVQRSVAFHDGAPSALLYDPIAHALYVESVADKSVTRLDPMTGRPIATVRLRGALRQMAANGRGTLYVANASRNALDVVNAHNMTLSGVIPLAGCRAPTGLAMDTIGRRLFVSCSNARALIVDADLGFTFDRLPVQRATSLRAVFAFHPLGARGWKGGVFIAGNGHWVDAIRMNAFVRYVSGGRLPLAAPCTALALSPAAGELWLALSPRASRGRDELLGLGRVDAGGSR